jgi:hypothetical protein
VIPLLPSEGLLANVLHVVEVVHRAKPAAVVRVDWVLNGSETGFRYGPAGIDVWATLFAGFDAPVPASAFRADQPLEFAFWGTGKDYLHGAELQAHRCEYSTTVSKWLTVCNQNAQSTADTMLRRLGRFSIGVHRRVGNPRVANLQREGDVPSASDFVLTVQAMIENSARADWRVYLATDDADAIGVFQAAFGSRLVFQDQVRRTTPDGTEVHYDAPSFANAEAAVVDTVVLAHCKVLIHASSSISTVAALMNPLLHTVRVRVGQYPRP